MRTVLERLLITLSIAFGLLAAPCAYAQDTLWQTMFDSGKEALQKGDYPTAEKQLQSALKNASSFSLKDDRLRENLVLLEIPLMNQGKYTDAEAICQRVIAIDEKKHAPPSVMAHDYDVLAKIYESTSQYVKAEELLQKALTISESKGGGDNSSRAQIMDSLAQFYCHQSRYAEAEPLLKQSLAIREKAFGESNEETLGAISNLGRFYVESGRHNEAEPLLKRAQATAELMYGKDSPKMAQSLFDLADLYEAKEKWRDAQPLLKRAVTLTSDLPPTSPQISVALTRLAANLEAQDRYDDAEQLYKKALDADERASGPSSMTLARDSNKLARLYLMQGKYSQAEPLYNNALSMVQSIEGNDHPNVAACLNNLSWLYLNEGKLQEAERMSLRGLNLREKTLGKNHRLVAQNMDNLAEILARQGRFNDAESLYKDALNIQKTVLGQDHPDTSTTATSLADLYFAAKQYSEAQDLYEKLLRRDEAAVGAEEPLIAFDLDRLATVLSAQGKVDEAEKMKARSANIKKNIPGFGKANTAPPPANAPCAIARPVKDKWALIIGISNFKDANLNLRYAAKDATDFRNYLVNEEHFEADHVRLITDKDATRDNIVANLGEGWLKKVANSDDLIVLYISSHGSPAQEEAGGTNFIVPYEGTKENIVLSGIPMQWLTSGIKNMVRCQRIIVALDVCHGGAATTANDPSRKIEGGGAMEGSRGLRSVGDKIDLNASKIGEGQVILAASASDQQSWESLNYQNGVFTRRLIEGLRQRGDKTFLGDAYKYMKDKVEEEVLRDRNQLQTPMFISSMTDADKLLLGTLPTSPQKGLEATTSKQAKR